MNALLRHDQPYNICALASADDWEVLQFPRPTYALVLGKRIQHYSSDLTDLVHYIAQHVPADTARALITRLGYPAGAYLE